MPIVVSAVFVFIALMIALVFSWHRGDSHCPGEDK
jgi:hypothetical protein